MRSQCLEDRPLCQDLKLGNSVFETLAGVSLGCRARVVRDGVALRVTHEDLFDLLAHRPDLLKQLFGALFSAPDAPRAR